MELDERPEWHQRAACRGRTDLQHLFFPLRVTKTIDQRVVRLCEGCCVRVECREYRKNDANVVGVWGGVLRVTPGTARKRTHLG